MNLSKGQRVALTSLFENAGQADYFQIGLSVCLAVKSPLILPVLAWTVSKNCRHDEH
jgi:hypothetical protein